MIISYAISAIMAFLSALTFVEMAVDFPLAGSSFNYTLAVRRSLLSTDMSASCLMASFPMPWKQIYHLLCPCH